MTNIAEPALMCFTSTVVVMDSGFAPRNDNKMMQDGSLVGWVWFALALVFFALEAFRPGRFALWFGFAAVLVGVVASVARWPWPAEIAAFAVFAVLLLPAWRRYERKT